MAEQEQATLGGGCFWCVEAVYLRVPGVVSVVSGYAGGDMVNPTYEQVCSGRTGHAEVVQVEFDPEVVSYSEILEAFWESHDPTTKDRQGHDVGTQYRSIILYDDEEQQQVILTSVDVAQGAFRQPIVTEIAPLRTFYPAEDHHKDYYARNGDALYCRAVIAPKIEKFEQAQASRATG